MQINQKTLRLLLSMNDEQLSAVVGGLARDAGIDPSALSLDASRLASIREALGSVTDADLASLTQIYESFRAQQRERGDTRNG